MIKYPEIDPVAISIDAFTIAGKTIGPLNIHWYGLMYLVGFATVWLLAWNRTSKRNMCVKANQVEDLIFYAAMGVVLGGRIGYVVFYNFEAWMNDFGLIFRIWEGGMSFHGGLIGTALALLLYARKIKQNFFDVVDFIAPFAPLGLFFGRIGNFIGGELYGRVTDVAWAMEFPGAPGELRHPSQLYEAFLEGLLLFCILFWFSAKPRPRGSVIGLFLFFYGIFRFCVEFVREPDSHLKDELLFGWITRGQQLCIPMIALGAFIVLWAYRKHLSAAFAKKNSAGQIGDSAKKAETA